MWRNLLIWDWNPVSLEGFLLSWTVQQKWRWFLRRRELWYTLTKKISNFVKMFFIKVYERDKAKKFNAISQCFRFCITVHHKYFHSRDLGFYADPWYSFTWSWWKISLCSCCRRRRQCSRCSTKEFLIRITNAWIYRKLRRSTAGWIIGNRCSLSSKRWSNLEKIHKAWECNYWRGAKQINYCRLLVLWN